jgi:hypothetical protein
MRRNVDLVRISPENRHFFFGYYDKHPWSKNQTKILGHEVFIEGKLPFKSDLADIGFFEQRGDKWFWKKLASSPCWNFQQGTMLQWLDESHIIFNQLFDKEVRACVMNIVSGSKRYLETHFYCLSSDKMRSYSVCFNLIHKYRPGYGYSHCDAKKMVNYRKTGLSSCDIQSGKTTLHIPFQNFIDENWVTNKDAFWIDHILPAPDDKHIAFFLRHLTNDGGVYTRLFFANTQDWNYWCALDTGMGSHACWIADDQFGIWARQQSFVKSVTQFNWSSLLKPIIAFVRKVGIPNQLRTSLYGDKFLFFNLYSDQVTSFGQRIPSNEGGGHFSFDNTSRWMLNDTLPNKKGERPLMIYDLWQNKRYDILHLKTPLDIHSTPWRCDLHPRWSPDNSWVCIDSIHEGTRGIYIANISPKISR